MLTFKDKKFYLDGEEFLIQSGAFHYFRALPEYWEDIMLKIKACGLNTVETYTCWNLHEKHKGEYDFSGMLDIERFLKTAQKVGLKVIVRPGPFICAEWENGGLPSWLLKREYKIRPRCMSEPYITFLKEWLHILFKKIRPYLDVNGGPIIAMAVENEYGSFGDDINYLRELEKVFIDEKMECLYFAADGGNNYYTSTGRSGKHIVQGIDEGGIWSLGDGHFKFMDTLDCPYFVAEYWAGNFTDWGYKECTNIPAEAFQKSLDMIEKYKSSFNMYMIFGGTNFGFTNGGQDYMNSTALNFNPVITSYDYDAAITEWGGYTERYMAIKEMMERDHGPAPIEMPKSPVLQNIGKVCLTQSSALFDNLSMGKAYKSVTVETMEEFGQWSGYILYSKTFKHNTYLDLVKLIGIHDRAQVFLNGEYVDVACRVQSDDAVIQLPKRIEIGDRLDILVENMGRICYGEKTYIGDRKGIDGAVVLTERKGNGIRTPGKITFNWDVTCLELDDVSSVKYSQGTDVKCPAFFKGTFKAENKNSCFVHFDNLTKGVIYINGFNIGRYWDFGPLKALYIPGVLLKEENEIVIFETDGIKGEASVIINDICGIENHKKEIII